MIISIIVPVYNVEKFLHRCIDSILAQTFADFELLLINDGSKDNSGLICDEYAAKDNRVRVFHKENGGASAARNYGLDNATGKYICFIDSDDWVENNYLETLWPAENEDMVVCSITYEGKEKWELSLWDKKYNRADLRDSLNYIVEHMAVCSPCCKILRRDTIEENKIRFDTDVCAGEDMLFVYDYLSVGLDKIHTTSLPLYHYYVEKSSLSHNVVPFDTTVYVMEQLQKKLKLVGDKYEWDYDHAYKGMLCTQLFNLIDYVKYKASLLEKPRLFLKILTNCNVKDLLYDRSYILQRRQYRALRRVVIYILLTIYRLLF